MAEFNLKEFLKNYKPKKVDILSYLKCPKLRSYKIMKNVDELVPLKMFIKYINEEDLFKDKKLDEHVRTGGFLISGGYYKDKWNRQKQIYEKKYFVSLDQSKWTHLLLKFAPSQMRDENGELLEKIEPKTFIIKIFNKQIFYKHFSNDIRRILEEYDIELV